MADKATTKFCYKHKFPGFAGGLVAYDSRHSGCPKCKNEGVDMADKEEKLIKILRVRMEEYGMPKFTDNFPAMDVFQIVQDAGYMHKSRALEMVTLCLKCVKGKNMDWDTVERIDCPTCKGTGIVLKEGH